MPSSLVDALAERLLDRLLERLPPTRAYDRSALAEAAQKSATEAEEPPLPRTVRHFLERMMARRVEVEQERLRVLRQPWLDHEHDDVRRAEEALIEAVRRHVRIPAEAWERVLSHACRQVAAHLVRPAPTLLEFVFGEGEEPGPAPPAPEGESPDLLPARVVQRRLSYFAAYPYLREAVSAYVEQRDARSFQRERLEAILRRVDERMCADHDIESWLRLLQPLFALGRAAYPHHDGLPAELLEAFFEEKAADFPLRRLRAAREEHGLAAISPSALGEILSPRAPAARASSGATEHEEPGAPSPEEQDHDAPPAGEAKTDAPHPETPGKDAEKPSATPSPGTPLWKRFAGPSSGEQKAPAPGGRGQGRDADGNGDRTGARPRWQQFSTASTKDEDAAPEEEASQEGDERAASPLHEPAEGERRVPREPPASPAPDALGQVEEEVLGLDAADGERARFVRELFDGSEEAYERVLRRLREAEDWQAATQIIARDVFRAHGVDIYSDPARAFTNAVEARYR